jgi:hypothetical protein
MAMIELDAQVIATETMICSGDGDLHDAVLDLEVVTPRELMARLDTATKLTGETPQSE